LEILAHIKWPCLAAAIPSIIDRLGWSHLRDGVHIEADTGWGLNWTMADFAHPHDYFTRMGFPVSDAVDGNDSSAMQVLRESFTAVLVSCVVNSLDMCGMLSCGENR
jgi:hypothetical protein